MINCEYCGTSILSKSLECPCCGAPVPKTVPQSTPIVNPTPEVKPAPATRPMTEPVKPDVPPVNEELGSLQISTLATPEPASDYETGSTDVQEVENGFKGRIIIIAAAVVVVALIVWLAISMMGGSSSNDASQDVTATDTTAVDTTAMTQNENPATETAEATKTEKPAEGFQSADDVFAYLKGKKFTNANGVVLTATRKGAFGNGALFGTSPQVQDIKPTEALLVYANVQGGNPIRLLLDSSKGTITDLYDGSVYK